MTTLENAYQTLKTMPPHLQNEVIDFIDFLKQKKLSSVSITQKKNIFGCAKGKIQMSEDFDDPLDMFADYMPE